MAEVAYKVPLTAKAQVFNIDLAGTTYKITLFWNVTSATWVINLATTTDTPILSAVPLVTGIDLLGQYAYLGIGGKLVVQTDYSVDQVPTIDNLGIDSHLYFVTAG